MKTITISILGFGQRGVVYSEIAKTIEDVKLVAVCESNLIKHEWIHQNYQVPKEAIYQDYNQFLKKGKLSDILVIATQDKDHYEHAMKALDCGYDLLLEKPIALKKEHIKSILDKANELKRKVSIAHVLRYTLFYSEIKKLIDSNALGKIMTLHQTENVGYFHYAHSYVRGNWHNSNTSSPMILAKSCHDIDIILYLMQKHVKKISSFGSLSYFKRKNKPNGGAHYCIDCKVECPFNAYQFYKENPGWMKNFTLEENVEKVMRDPKLDYSKCAYEMDNNVVDHQILNMLFEDNTTASFTMTAFSNTIRRNIEIKATKAELYGDLEDNIIHVRPFGKPGYDIDIKLLTDDLSNHAGGDTLLFKDFIVAVRDNTPFITDINYAVESHYIALEAENSRLKEGSVIGINL